MTRSFLPRPLTLGQALAFTLTLTLATLTLCPPAAAQTAKAAQQSNHERLKDYAGLHRRTAAGAESEVTCSAHSNGCSVPKVFRSSFDKDIVRVMTPSCDNHDMCYDCGRYYFVSRKRCDDVFLDEMYRACHRLMPSQVASGSWRTLKKSRRLCLNTARTFYLGVSWFGHSSYAKRNRVPRYCPEVKHCVPRA
ncbi:conodipine-P1-like [Babylonia areolata]|uniref:conodipine-P1-like n=1 Tax=Babylonia areolata TaxID=304850 RepID=UPI003FD4EF7D